MNGYVRILNNGQLRADAPRLGLGTEPAEDEEAKDRATSSALAASRRAEPRERGRGSRGTNSACELCKESPVFSDARKPGV